MGLKGTHLAPTPVNPWGYSHMHVPRVSRPDPPPCRVRALTKRENNKFQDEIFFPEDFKKHVIKNSGIKLSGQRTSVID
jgi:hypothetical protein